VNETWIDEVMNEQVDITASWWNNKLV